VDHDYDDDNNGAVDHDYDDDNNGAVDDHVDRAVNDDNDIYDCPATATSSGPAPVSTRAACRRRLLGARVRWWSVHRRPGPVLWFHRSAAVESAGCWHGVDAFGAGVLGGGL